MYNPYLTELLNEFRFDQELACLLTDLEIDFDF